MKFSTYFSTVYFYLIYVNILETNGAKILGVSWYPAVSHQAFFQPIWKQLSLRGHQVTTISPLPMKDKTLKNLTEIDISVLFEIRSRINTTEMLSKDKTAWELVRFSNQYVRDLVEMMLNTSKVQALIRSDEKFDVVIVEPHTTLVFAFGERFKAPVIALSSFTCSHEVYDLVANPTHPLISPDHTLPLDSSALDHPFSSRLSSFLHNIWERMYYYWYILPETDKVAKKYFGSNFPYLGDICEQYTSLLITNVNFITHPVRANVPKVVEINQVHIRENRPLPKYLKTFLDNSRNGAVYFSLGTHVASKDLNNRTLAEIVQAFSELPFNVLWKYEDENLPVIPKNVLIKKMFPQQDLLGHPNVKVFVTQGGVQSIEEAISREVPMVGIPFFGDQPLNVKRLVDIGVAIRLQASEITKASLKNAILEVAQNKSFKKAVKKYKILMEDQPMKGADKAVWWIEYVIRHKGADHIQSPAVKMSYYTYFMLDVIAFILMVIFCIHYFLYRFISFFLSRFKKLKLKSD